MVESLAKGFAIAGTLAILLIVSCFFVSLYEKNQQESLRQQLDMGISPTKRRIDGLSHCCYVTVKIDGCQYEILTVGTAILGMAHKGNCRRCTSRPAGAKP